MEDLAERAFIAYFTVVMLLLIGAALVVFLNGKPAIKAIGALIFLAGCVAVAGYEQALDWLYRTGALNYLP